MKKRLHSILLTLIAVALVFSLTACIPNGSGKAKEKMKEKGYSALVYSASEFSDDPKSDGVVDGLMAFNPKSNEYLVIVYFDTRVNAKKNFERYSSQLQEEFESDGLKFTVALSGKSIYIGTEQAIKDLKSV